MKAVGHRESPPVCAPECLVDLTLPDPQPAGRDLLVEVHAVSVNSVDTKVRRGVAPPVGEARTLGWNVVGVVRAVGGQASLFKPGDRVMYAGSLLRPGTNSELHLVDERIVGRAPASLGDAAAAALPLTSITAWELLFVRLQVRLEQDATGVLLVIGGAGGVGSSLVQLARQLMTVVATALRPETRERAMQLGAHHVIDDTIVQHYLLNRINELIDAGVLRSTLAEHFGTINAANLKRAHALLESGKARGKIVLSRF
ncbi:zinc-binding dehydrogenase [Massilia sp. TW-1]|uniref:Zinc-binding dehydrogenase n=1 Tax=Telluria antibiotica TaxID=2717319 RepID=A0ABX0PAV2_9BURK|nr:zinc-binding dehydrogenase [Telluria antibiotica]NIA53789.1 zinc-binding dehydrogenase [Telluria antibiotica]